MASAREAETQCCVKYPTLEIFETKNIWNKKYFKTKNIWTVGTDPVFTAMFQCYQVLRLLNKKVSWFKNIMEAFFTIQGQFA